MTAARETRGLVLWSLAASHERKRGKERRAVGVHAKAFLFEKASPRASVKGRESRSAEREERERRLKEGEDVRSRGFSTDES